METRDFHASDLRYVAIFILLYGIFCISAPDAATRFRVWFWAKNAEPTKFALVMTRIIGVVISLISIWIIFS